MLRITGSSFKLVKAVLYSQDPGSKSNGGLYQGITKTTGFVKEFKDVAFSLDEGEISEPFETQFGYHLMMLDKIRGQERDVRHILISPKISEAEIKETVKELDTIRQHILDGKYTFAEAALNFSDEKETKFDGGVLRNPIDFGPRFELTNMDPRLYNQIRNLEDGEVSKPMREDGDRGGPPQFKLMKISNRFDEHKADFAKDYMKIQQLALKEKQFKEISKWMNKYIEENYIHVSVENRDCDFTNNWVKK